MSSLELNQDPSQFSVAMLSSGLVLAEHHALFRSDQLMPTISYTVVSECIMMENVITDLLSKNHGYEA